MKRSNPFELLLDLENRTLQATEVLSAIEQVEDDWVGIGFRIGDTKLITDMADVKEILDVPDFTTVPGVKSWVVGVANVRGNLLPIMDLKGYLLGDEIRQLRKGRVIVIDYQGFDTGMVVEEVYGMRHFREGEVTQDIPDVNERISPFITSAFKQEDEHWPVFSMDALTHEERFANASL